MRGALKNKMAFARGAAFVLNKGTKRLPNKKKESNKRACKQKEDGK